MTDGFPQNFFLNWGNLVREVVYVLLADRPGFVRVGFGILQPLFEGSHHFLD